MLRTASQRKTICRSCPMAKTADLIGDSCALLIVRDCLEQGPRRFSELSQSLEGISSRTLASKLKQLEKENILTHAKDGAYALTPKGKALKPVVDAMRHFGKKHL